MKIKKKAAVVAYDLLKNINLKGVSLKGKLHILCATSAFRKVTEDFVTAINEAEKELKNEQYQEMYERAAKWNAEGDASTLSEDEKKEINDFFRNYDKEILAIISPETELDIDLGNGSISREDLAVIADSLTVEALLFLGDILCNN